MAEAGPQAAARAVTPAQRNLEKLATLGLVTAGVAHDLNNLLTVIIGRCEVLQSSADTGPLSTHLDVIRRAALDAAAIVGRLQGARRAPVGPVRLADVVAYALAFTAPRWQDAAKGNGSAVEVVTELDPLPPMPVDEPALREVLVNLILNALDAMPAGGRLTVRLRRAGRVILEVSDTGEGIPPALLERVFEPLFTTRPDGTGIGLAVCKELASQLGGEIEVESVPGEGTTMRLCLPRPAPGHRRAVRSP